MLIKKLGLVMVSIGMITIAMNAYWLAKGMFSYSEPPITEAEFFLKEEETPMEITVSTYNKRDESAPLYDDTPVIGEKIGLLTIPKLDKSFSIYHGTTKEVLKKGVGHYEKSALPGETNNCVLSGHRDTVFWQLGDVGVNDKLIVSTEAGEFLYKVKKVRIVDEDDRTVIVPKPKSTLTVTTCYPFGFVGDAPQRFVLVAELISKNVAMKNQHSN